MGSTSGSTQEGHASGRPAQERRRYPRHGATVFADLLYDGFYSSAVGGSVLGLFFLLVDSAGGHPFLTPSIMGSVLFLGVPPDAVTEVRLDMVAYFTLIHFTVFGALGMALAVMVYEVELHSRHPGKVMAALFLVLEGGFLASANLLMPGTVAVIGFGRVLVGNLLTALAMAAFMLRSHRPDAWQRLLRGYPID